ncbi:DUF308 domain-containing protein [Streptomyces sp. LHD-70]|uniref:HdeD family acid-resistance protein n=1 Tax=Streptomyces sp. LHD-70 TaxID=3072140 RepID=UPI00280F2243|nr:DUF308 domain-containing protein [Streptomyces sp. LHD-70]MDQ8706249.1 DUF308 domain-containing protein [Streptomyces sp. LHD-70]
MAKQTKATTPKVTTPEEDGRKLRRGFVVLALLGAVLVIGGLVGLIYVGVATLTSMFLFGWLLLIGGLVGLLQSVQLRGTSVFWLGVVVAALYIAAGAVVLRHPEGTAEALTMFAALLFLAGGVFRLVGSVVVRGPHFGLTLVQGAFGLLLGVLVLAEWPGSSLYVIGTFFSLALLFDGLGLIALGLGGRRLVRYVTDSVTPGNAEAGGDSGDPLSKGSLKAEQDEQDQSPN